MHNPCYDISLCKNHYEDLKPRIWTKRDTCFKRNHFPVIIPKQLASVVLLVSCILWCVTFVICYTSMSGFVPFTCDANTQLFYLEVPAMPDLRHEKD